MNMEEYHMPTPESLLEDVTYLMKKLSALHGDELKSLCRDPEHSGEEYGYP